MDPVSGAIIASALLPAIGSAFGQSQANKANLRIAREQMGFQKESQAKAMAFEERMSGSAYQRAVQDMKLAGINPMLAINQGGASTPGISPMGGASAQMEDVVGPAVSSAQQGRRLGQELKLMDAQIANVKEDTEVKFQQGLESIARKAQAYSARDLNAATRSNTLTATELARLTIPGQRNQAEIDRGRLGGVAAWSQRLFGGRILNPLGLRR